MEPLLFATFSNSRTAQTWQLVAMRFVLDYISFFVTLL